MQIIINIFQYIGKILLFPVCYLLEIIGTPLAEEHKNNPWVKMFAGVVSVTAMIIAIYVLPMFKMKKKRRYTKKSSRRRKRK